MLILVDCAGSERKEDSNLHNAERRKEGAEINQSLHALKECMRQVTRRYTPRCIVATHGLACSHRLFTPRQWVAREDGRNTLVNYRNSALTRVLEESFTRKDTLMAVVGTLSPAR